MTVIFIRVIKTIVVTITYVDTRNTMSIIASEEVSKASSSFGMAILWWLITSVKTIIISITIPSGRYASVVGTPEAILWTRAL